MASDRNEKMKVYRAKSQTKKFVQDMLTIDEVEWLEELIDIRIEQLLGEEVVLDEPIEK